MESIDIYNTDIEMIMDFMKLSLAYDDKNMSDNDRFDIIKLQKAILELLPVAQSNRMSAVYGFVTEIYRKNKKEYVDSVKPLLITPSSSIVLESAVSPRATKILDRSQSGAKVLFDQRKESQYVQKQKEDHIIILFYKSTCPSSQRIMGDWFEFKRQHKDSPFTILDYDSNNPENIDIFRHFKVTFVPAVFKLTFDAKDKNNLATKMKDTITHDSLHKFAIF